MLSQVCRHGQHFLSLDLADQPGTLLGEHGVPVELFL
jgi:hypothetical protein